MAHVQVHRSVELGSPGDWQLCFQLVTYHYETGDGSGGGAPEHGYRFIWLRPEGKLQGARGQARIPDGAAILRLTGKAAAAGWFFSTEPELAAYVGTLSPATSPAAP